MRKIIAIEFITMDGVIQSPGAPDEDREGDFDRGGWIAGYSATALSEEIRSLMYSDFDLLLGRKTYDIWKSHWPRHNDVWPQANSAVKYVATCSPQDLVWQPAIRLGRDLPAEILELKSSPGNDLHLYGSSELAKTLMAHSLINEIRLKIFPIILGSGKTLFSQGISPNSFQLFDSRITECGVILANYRRISTNNL